LYSLPILYGMAFIVYMAAAGILWLVHRLGREELLLPVGAMDYILLLTISQYMASKIGAYVGPLVVPMGVITYSASVSVLDFLTLSTVGCWLLGR